MSHVTHVDAWCAGLLFGTWLLLLFRLSCLQQTSSCNIWMRYVTQMNGSRHTYECDMPHWWMRHATHMNESCHSYGWVMCWASFLGHGCSCFFACLVYSRFRHATYECVKQHIWMSQAIPMNATCYKYRWVTLHIWMSHVLGFFFGTWLLLLFRLPCLLQTSSRDTWRSCAAHMNESSYTYEWDMPHILMSHVIHIIQSCAVLLFWDMAAPAVSLALSAADFVMRHVKELRSTYEWVKPFIWIWVMPQIWMSHVTHMNESCAALLFWDMAAPAVSFDLFNAHFGM